MVGAGLSFSSCGGYSGTGPTPDNGVLDNEVLGSYSGSVENTWQHTGSMSMTIARSGRALKGTWSVTWPSWLGGVVNTGLLTGGGSGRSIRVTLVPDNPMPCPSYDATASFDGSGLSGAYTSLHCPKAAAGDLVALRSRDADFTLVKQ